MPLDTTSPAECAHQAVLDELVALGTSLARQVHAAAEAGDLALDGATIAFDRIARAVRRTVLLSRRLAEPAAARPEQQRTAARKRILRDVEDTIARTTKGGPDGDKLHAELHERLDAPDLDDDIATRPVAEIIADICRDLGIATPPGMPRPWKRRTPADLAALVARATHLPPPGNGGPGQARHPPGPNEARPPPRVSVPV